MTFKPSKFLDPKSDIVFKKIFGQNADLVKSFLNGIMPFKDGGLIETVSYLPAEQTPRIPSLKNTIVDVKCTDQSGRIFIIEMQMSWSASFTKRLLFGVSKAYVQQLDSGENYVALCPVYGLGIVNAIFDRDTDEWFHHYRSVNVRDTSKVLEGLELVFLELPKFKPQTLEHKRMGILWLRFLREINEKVVEVPREFIDSPELSKAMELAQESSYTPLELEAYDKYWDAVRVEKSITIDAFQEGKTEGIAIGKTEGIEIGEAKGRTAERITMAQGMLKAGIPIDVITRISGLPKEQIEKLRD